MNPDSNSQEPDPLEPDLLKPDLQEYAQVDHQRMQRCGHPEVIFCQGKQPEQAVSIAAEILSQAPRCLLTRAEPAHAKAILERFPKAHYDAPGRCIRIDPEPLPKQGLVAVVAAGTADLPVAQEALQTLEFLGAHSQRHMDVGVAGLHRLLDRIPQIREARVTIAIAGMEGALPSVLAGMLSRPVIAVPTSVGYGLHLDGIAPLLAMLNSCAAGVGVVNIDNGFGAAYLAAQINNPPA